MSTMVMEPDTGEHGFLEDDDVRTYGRHASGYISDGVEKLRIGQHNQETVQGATVAELVARLEKERGVVPDDVTEILTTTEPVKGVTLSPRYVAGPNSEADAEQTQGFRPVFPGASFRSRLPGDPGFRYDEPPIWHATGATEIIDWRNQKVGQCLRSVASATPARPSLLKRAWKRFLALAGV